jgi:hypothetical protein
MLASTHLTRGNRTLRRRSEHKKNKSLRRVKTLSTGARVEEGPSWLKNLIIWRQGITRLKEKKISLQVWTTETWPKVSTFLWLLARKKVYTGISFKGLSIYFMCSQEAQSTEHLFNPYAHRKRFCGIFVLLPSGNQTKEGMSFEKP